MGLSSPPHNCSPAFQPGLARAACKLRSPQTKFVFGKEQSEGVKRFQQNLGAKNKSKRNSALPLPRSYRSRCTLLEEEQMWDLELLITMALFQKSPSFPLLVGIFFLQSQPLLIWVDPKNTQRNPLLFIIQKPLARF